MKPINSTTKDDILSIWAGQLLLFCLKADTHDIVLLRHDFLCRVEDLLETKQISSISGCLAVAYTTFCHALKEKFSLAPEAEFLLNEKTTNFCYDFIEAKDFAASLSSLKVVDAWAGLSSCIVQKLPMPLSLGDYILEILLPILSGDLLPKLCEEIDMFFADETSQTIRLESIDSNLKQIVKRLCFNSFPNNSAVHEFELTILMHLPKENKDFATKTGFIFKLFQSQFLHQEDL